jgi:hypothetical protein
MKKVATAYSTSSSSSSISNERMILKKKKQLGNFMCCRFESLLISLFLMSLFISHPN